MRRELLRIPVPLAGTPDVFVSFHGFFVLVLERSPFATVGKKKADLKRGDPEDEAKIRAVKSKIRKVYVRFLTYQARESQESATASTRGELNWTAFVRFVQHNVNDNKNNNDD